MADDTTATVSASRVPQTMREKMSRPKLSVPSQCSAPGGVYGIAAMASGSASGR